MNVYVATFIPLRLHKHSSTSSIYCSLRRLLTIYVNTYPSTSLGIRVPESMRLPLNNTCTEDSIVLCLIRWLSPHPDALLRDQCLRPLCPPPFGINHTLWTFTKTRTRRPYFSDALFARQLDLFPGSTRDERRQNALTLSYARYGLVTLESINTYMNCTSVLGDIDSILETITLPFKPS